ncbi:Cof-type HAD-IIB family hydrolase [Bacillus sp. FJAT-45350]|uniref:Cof-type HAD-IIB family hydrolase n=1 Tax=Bacillus sp. FJAT-45350 TaxID=2011014 RepID=UPI000BB8927D|nr:Cof-type HAD-IIB family hydrolase [Bacillus sp. FJAT-45350]
MEKKLVFLDIDGTILDEEKNIPDSALEAISLLKKNGIHVAIATGRAPFMFQTLCKDLSIDSYISFNGSYIVDKGEVIYKNPLSKSHLQTLESHAANSKHPMVFLDHKTARSNHEEHPYIVESIGSLKLPYPPYQPTFYQEKEIFQALLFCEEEHESTYLDTHKDFDFVRWHPYSIDVLPLGGSKARGIEELLKKWDIKIENTFAFGDGLNDLEMLAYVGTGVAMGNAVDPAKKVADLVTNNVHEDGLYHGLKKLGLI